MAGPAPVREGFEAERFADWLPTSYWAISDENMETVLTFNTTDFNHNLDSRYAVKIEYYEGKNEPVFRHCLTPDEIEDKNLRIRLADLRAQYGLAKIDGMMLVSVRNESVGTPARPYYVTTWGTYLSADGKQVMSFPGQPIIGAEKSYRGFQVWPGAMADGTFETFIVLVNPFNRSQEYTAHLYDLNGNERIGRTLTIGRKFARRIALSEAVDDPAGHLAATGGVGSLTVHSAYKIVLFGGAMNLKTGGCSGLDHFSPFLVPLGGTSQETFRE
jgi:hypothetical protein